MPYQDGLPKPRVVAYNLASSTYDYMMRLVSLGVVEGELGSQTVPHDIRKTMEALHHVLAGGEVKIELVRRGNPDIVNELNERFDSGLKEANEINHKSGYYFTVS